MDVDAPDDLSCIVEFAEIGFTKVLNQLINNDLCSWSLWNIQHSQTSIQAWFGSFEDVDALEDVSCIERLFLKVISKKFHDASVGCGRKHTSNLAAMQPKNV